MWLNIRKDVEQHVVKDVSKQVEIIILLRIVTFMQSDGWEIELREIAF